MQREQFERWAFLTAFSKHHSVAAAKRDLDSGAIYLRTRNESGLHLVHLVAANDNLPLLQWLIEDGLSNVDELDGNGRTALQVAEASDAHETFSWLSRRVGGHRISRFVSTRYQRRRLYMKSSAVSL
jgi:ankyrin repeat protein